MTNFDSYCLRKLTDEAVTLCGPDGEVIAVGIMEWSRDLQQFGVPNESGNCHVTFTPTAVSKIDANMVTVTTWTTYPFPTEKGSAQMDRIRPGILHPETPRTNATGGKWHAGPDTSVCSGIYI